MAMAIATRSGCWYVFMVDFTSVPPSRVYEMVFRGQGINMQPMKPARNPNDPRRPSFKTPRWPRFVTNDVNHPVSVPIAIPATAYAIR